MNINLESINHYLLLAVIVVCIIIDWRTTKIPNIVTFPAAACGVILNFMSGSWHGALMAALGWFIAVALTIILGNLPIAGSKSGGIGMGDVKLLGAVGAFLGPKSALISIFYFCLSFGILSCLMLATKVPWKQVGIFVSTAIFDGDTSNVRLDTTKLNAQRRSPMPISICILIGAALAIYFRTQTLAFFGLP